jgi:VWFA-related protein
VRTTASPIRLSAFQTLRTTERLVKAKQIPFTLHVNSSPKIISVTVLPVVVESVSLRAESVMLHTCRMSEIAIACMTVRCQNAGVNMKQTKQAVTIYTTPVAALAPVSNTFVKILLSLGLIGLFCCVITAQHALEKKQKKKTVGFSLRQLNQPSKKDNLDSRTKPREIEGEQSGAADETIKIDTLLAVFDFLVIDPAGKAVENLGKEDFTVAEDEVQQDVALFTSGDDTRNPRSIILIIEWSNTAHYIENSLVAAQTFIERLGPQDEMAIVTSDVKVVCPFTKEKKDLKAALQVLKEKISRNSSHSAPAESSLPTEQMEFETLLAVLQELLDEPARHMVIFQADGGEALYLRDQSRHYAPARTIGLVDVLSVVARSRATIYPIIPDFQYVGLAPDEQINRARQTIKDQIRDLPESQAHLFLTSSKLRNIIDSAVIAQTALMRVASLSGAWSSFLERPDQAQYIYSRILADANKRYVLAYHVADKSRDGRLRSVRIQVRGHPEYLVQGRKSYSIR